MYLGPRANGLVTWPRNIPAVIIFIPDQVYGFIHRI